MSTINGVYFSESNTENYGTRRVLRLGKTNGIQICTGEFERDRPATIQLNAVTTNPIYTGTTYTDISPFEKEFKETPVILAMPQGSGYWFGDILADKAQVSHMDFYTNKSYANAAGSKLTINGKYVAIGTFEDSANAPISNLPSPMWNGSDCVRIPTSANGGIQICVGTATSTDKVNVSTKLNGASNIYTASATSFTTTGHLEGFSETPTILAAPSLMCRDWTDGTTFEHPYWFGSVVGSFKNNVSSIARIDVYTNASISKKIYARYIAIGKYTADNTTGWRTAEISYNHRTTPETIGCRMRIYDPNDATHGLQICFDNFSSGGFALNTKLNGNSTIYTGCLKQASIFQKSFTKSPSVIVQSNQTCRGTVAKPTASDFVYPYWYGDATSNAVSLMNLDAYTNKSLSGKTASGQYIAMGTFSEDCDKSSLIVRQALKHLGDAYGNTVYADYKEYIDPDYVKGTGWCSEFASLMAYRAGYTSDDVPKAAGVKTFIRKLAHQEDKYSFSSSQYTANDTRFYMAKNSNATFVQSVLKSKADSSTVNYGDAYPIYCTEVENGAETTPQVGDFIFFDNGKEGHTGLIINVNGSNLYTVEGNTTMTDDSSETSRVLMKKYKLSDARIIGIGQLNWSEISASSDT